MRRIVLIIAILVPLAFADTTADSETNESTEYENFMSENSKKIEKENSELKKLAAFYLNIFPFPLGLGSFIIMGDITGGIIQLALNGTGLTLMQLNKGVATCYENCGSVAVFSVGAIMFLSGSIYGMIRPFYYDKPQNTVSTKTGGFNAVILPNERSDFKVYLFYNKAF